MKSTSPEPWTILYAMPMKPLNMTLQLSGVNKASGENHLQVKIIYLQASGMTL